MAKQKVNIVKHISIKEIKSPEFLSALNYKELSVLSDDIRKEIIEQVSIHGGHLSSNLGVVELTIALHRCFDLSKDKLIFDVGHQSYTHKILTGRSLDTLRTKDGISGFQKVSESKYDCFEAGHSSTSLSVASGFALARDLNKEKYNVIAFIGDSSIVNGLAFEALNNIAHSGHKIIIILNDNDMSISKSVGAMSKAFSKISTGVGYNKFKSGYEKFMTKTKFGTKLYNFSYKIKQGIKRILAGSNVFTDMGFAYYGPINGNNIKEVEKALKRANNTKKSVIIHAHTLKGKGYIHSEQDTSGSWHGVAPFDIESGELKVAQKRTWSDALADICLAKMKENDKTILVCPATEKGSSLDRVFEEIPERCIDVGIAEEHAVTMAGGLSINGYHPIISIYSTFLQRAYDEVSHDIARMNLGATFLVDRSGLVGLDGDTHQGIYDESFIYSIPNSIITMPSTENEAEQLFEESLKHKNPFFVRIPREEVKTFDNDNKIEFGKWIKIKESKSKKVAVVGVGPLVRELCELCTSDSVDCTIYNAIYANMIDEEAVSELLGYDKIVIYDAYSTRYGLVNDLMAYLLEKKFKGAISAFYIPNEFVKQATIKEQLEQFNLLPEQVIKAIKN